ncbi:MAG: hypothetical protein GPJ54_11880 [Candidatus Heimdallarchaeota archaeon]|nr:hypothetical protein [Candidatus Heimdallarchaeota archaeon]
MRSKLFSLILFYLVFFNLTQSNVNAASEPSQLVYSDNLELGDDFTWFVKDNIKSGIVVETGQFKVGAKINIEITGNITLYNHYTLQAENDLENIFDMNIDGSFASAIFVMDFLIPVVFVYPDGSLANLFNVKLTEEVENTKLVETIRDINNNEYRNIVTSFHENGTRKFYFENRFQASTGLLNVLHVESADFLLRIEREGYQKTENFIERLDFSSIGLVSVSLTLIALIVIFTRNKKK